MPLSRKKSCARCRQSKLRCNLGTPSCSQCMRRRFKCVYDGRDSERVTPYSFQSSSMPSASSLSDPLQAVVDTTPPVLDALEHPDIVSDTAASLIAGGAGDGDEDALLDFTGEGLPFDWQSIGRPAYSGLETPKSFGIDTIELLPAITPRDAAFFGGEQQGFGLLDAQAHPFSHGSVMNVDMSQRDAGPSSPPHDAQLVSTSAAPSDQKVLRRRLFLKECVLTSVVLGQLTGYPRMMLEGELLPPFIQAPCHYDEEQAPECRIAGRHRCLPEILAVCASLVEMFYARTPANERYVWKTIYAERARLRKNFHLFDRHEQLAAVQAVTVFMLLQADDLSTVEKNDAGALLNTAMEFITTMSSTYMWQPDSFRVRPIRREWAFFESIRRIGTIFCIIDLLLEGMQAPEGHTCEEGVAFGQSFLPCGRDIWEARSTSRWITNFDRYLARKHMDEDLRGIHLLESKLSSSGGGSSSACMGPADNKSPNADVVHWCEGLDMLGTLVWMVVPLHRYRTEQLRERMAR